MVPHPSRVYVIGLEGVDDVNIRPDLFLAGTASPEFPAHPFSEGLHVTAIQGYGRASRLLSQ